MYILKYLLFILISLNSLLIANNLSHISIYGVDSKKSEANNGKSSNGMGIYYDTEEIKVKVENTADSLKLGGVFKYNYTENWIIKAGLTYLNEKMYAYDYSTARVNQYGYALGLGYKISDTLYAEVAGNVTELKGKNIGSLYKINDETTKRFYGELVKRLMGDYGTLDATVNAGKTYHEFTDNESFVGGGINYYPISSAKVSLFYNSEENNKYTSYSLNYKALELSYVDVEDNAHYLALGFKLECSDIFNISSCKIPTNIIPDISENDKFEQMTFLSGMEIQSSEKNPVTYQCIKPPSDWTITSSNIGLIATPLSTSNNGMLGSIKLDNNGCFEINKDYIGSDMFFGQTGTPEGFQDFDWYTN